MADMQTSFMGEEKMEEEDYDEKYECKRVNGVLAPEPISQVPPHSPKQASSFQEQDILILEEQQKASVAKRTRKRRKETKFIPKETKYVSFRLLRCQDKKNKMYYFLEDRESATGITTTYILSPYEKDGMQRVKAKEYKFKNQETISMVEELEPSSFMGRLDGEWEVQVRQRSISSSKIEKFYLHEKANKILRSASAVATFILLGITY